MKHRPRYHFNTDLAHAPAYDLARAHVTLGGGCSIGRLSEDGLTASLEHLPRTPAKKLSWVQQSREIRRRHWSNAKRWQNKDRVPQAEVRERMAEAYARWLAERDGVKIPQGAKVRFERGWLADHGDRFQAVQFGHLETEAQHYRHMGRMTTRATHRVEVFHADVTIQIPHWDHVPLMSEQTLA